MTKTKKFEEYSSIITLDFGMTGFTDRTSKDIDDDIIGVKHIRGNMMTQFRALCDIIQSLPTGSLIVGEDSHIGTERKELSLSQPFSFNLLEYIYDLCEELGHHLRLFPQKSTPKAIAFTQQLFSEGAYVDSSKSSKIKIEKSDSIDPFSLFTFIKHNPTALETLKHPTKSWKYSDEQQAAHEMVKYCNRDANLARAFIKDDGELASYMDDSDAIIPFIKDVLVPNILSTWNKKQLSIIIKNIDKLYYSSSSKKYGYQKGDINWNQVIMVQLYSMCLTIMEPNGNPRLATHTGDIAGRAFTKKWLIRNTPYHYRGGVIASNEKHWGFKAWVQAECFVDRGEHRIPLLDKNGNVVLTKRGNPKKVKVLKDPNIDLTRKVGVEEDKKIVQKTVTPGRFNEAEKDFFQKNRSFYSLTWIQGRQLAKKLYLEYFAENYENARNSYNLAEV
jgi:hypothetical protein